MISEDSLSPAATAKLLQSCPNLCDPIDSSPPGSAVPGILQARTLEWVAMSFSNAWKWKVKMKSLSRVQLFATPWTAAYQAPAPMGFSRQEYWSGLPLPSPLWALVFYYCKENHLPSMPLHHDLSPVCSAQGPHPFSPNHTLPGQTSLPFLSSINPDLIHKHSSVQLLKISIPLSFVS